MISLVQTNVVGSSSVTSLLWHYILHVGVDKCAEVESGQDNVEEGVLAGVKKCFIWVTTVPQQKGGLNIYKTVKK